MAAHVCWIRNDMELEIVNYEVLGLPRLPPKITDIQKSVIIM